MKRLLLITLLIHFYYFPSAQGISDYRKIADQLLINHFDSTIGGKVTYKTFEVRTKNTIYSEYGYRLDKSKIKNFDEIVFEYSYHSPELKHTFTIFVPVAQSKLISDTDRIFRNIPMCVSKHNRCGLIPSDSAIAIARKSKISFRNNLFVRLEFYEKSNEFVWVVYARDPKASTVGRGGYSANQVRYINAVSGSIIEWSDYHK